MKAVEVPTLKALFLETYYGATRLSSATVTLVTNSKDGHCTLITNRHVVTGKHQDTGKCLSKTGGIPDRIIVYFHKSTDTIGEDWVPIELPLYREDESPNWIEHPKLGPKADVVAINVSWGSDTTRYPYFLEGDLDSANLLVGPAETVSVIGFPFGISSSGKFPVWATGFIAQELSLVSDERPTFLIDCRTRQGQSGSPVIAFRPGVYRRKTEEKISTTVSANKVWEFLGVYSGRVNPESDLGLVWHKRVIKDLLEAATQDFNSRMRVSVPATSD